jgi:hypothetical protein
MEHHPALGTVAQWVSAIATVAGLILVILSARWAAAQWRMQYLTEQWGKTVDFLFDNPQYLDPDKNAKYQDWYRGDEAQKYGLVARRSISYVDDLFHLRLRGHLKSWLKGSMELFVKPHLGWFKDHRHFYSDKFVEAVLKEFGQSLKP